MFRLPSVVELGTCVLPQVWLRNGVLTHRPTCYSRNFKFSTFSRVSVDNGTVTLWRPLWCRKLVLFAHFNHWATQRSSKSHLNRSTEVQLPIFQIVQFKKSIASNDLQKRWRRSTTFIDSTYTSVCHWPFQGKLTNRTINTKTNKFIDVRWKFAAGCIRKITTV
jgi:hypothetical protein